MGACPAAAAATAVCPGSALGPAGAGPWLARDPTSFSPPGLGFGLCAMGCSSRGSCGAPSNPVHLEIQVFWRGVEIPKPEVGAGAFDRLRTLFVAPRTQSRGVEGLCQEPEGCTMAQAAAGGL